MTHVASSRTPLLWPCRRCDADVLVSSDAAISGAGNLANRGRLSAVFDWSVSADGRSTRQSPRGPCLGRHLTVGVLGSARGVATVSIVDLTRSRPQRRTRVVWPRSVDLGRNCARAHQLG